MMDDVPSVVTSHLIEDLQYDRNDETSEPMKVIVIGDSGVGKSALATRFCYDIPDVRPTATIGFDYADKTLAVDGRIAKIQLWDTAGQERFRQSMVSQYYRRTDAIVFVYDVTDLPSFNSLPRWLAESHQQIPFRTTPAVLVGNKTDKERGRAVVTPEAGRRFATRHNLYGSYRVTALEESGADEINTVFRDLARIVIKQRASYRKQLEARCGVSQRSVPTPVGGRSTQSSTSPSGQSTPVDSSPAIYSLRKKEEESMRRMRLRLYRKSNVDGSLCSSWSSSTEKSDKERRKKNDCSCG